jgi:hypothetical protein
VADRLQLMVEAERRGILPPEKVALLAEARKRGLVKSDVPQEMPPVPSMGGMGGFNPMARRFMGGAQAVTEAAGITPENSANPIANAAGIGEFIPQAISGTAGAVAGGLAGIGQGIKNLVSPGMPAGDRVRQVQEALTYQPRTGAGAGMARAVGAPGEIWQAGTNRVGEFVTDVTGSPALGAAVKTVGDVAPAVVGARAAPKRPKEPRQTGKYVEPPKPDIPTTEQLSKAAKQAYSDAKNSGVVVPADSYAKALERIQGEIKEVGINNTLHPKTAAVLKQLDESKGKDLSITEAENLRRVIQEVAGDLDPVTRKPTADAFRASKMLDEFDDAIDALSVNSEARALWARSRRSQMLDDMIARAEVKAGAHYTQAGMEHALRQEFKQLALNPRRMRGFTSEQRKAIEKVAKGGPVENTLRALGKFDPTSGVVPAMAGVVTGAGLAPLTGGSSFALPAIGFGAKRLATRATARNVDAAREAIVGRGIPNASPRATAPTTQGRAAGPAAPATGRSPATARAPEAIQADIQRLLSDAQNVPPGPLGAARMAAIELRLALLERELSAQDAPQQGAR